MSQLISSQDWDAIRSIIKDAHDTFNQDHVLWLRPVVTIKRYFEDGKQKTYSATQLKCYVGYNFFRNWPINPRDEGGTLDFENMYILINRDYLIENSWTNSHGYFNFDGEQDLFMHRGILYKAEGDTLVSQAFNIPLFVQVILKRQPTKTGDIKIDTPQP